MTALLLAGGLGSRMTPLTMGEPKELLPLGGVPTVARAIGEARAAGIERIVVVSARDKPALDGFLRDYRVEIVHPPARRGLVDAVACAEVDDDAVVLPASVTLLGGSPVARMAELLEKGIDGAVAVDSGDRRHGVVEVDEWRGGVRRVLSEDDPEAAAFPWAVAGRYAFSRRLMAFLSDAAARHGELDLISALNGALDAGFDLKAVALGPEARRVDVGTPEEYEEARRLPW